MFCFLEWSGTARMDTIKGKGSNWPFDLEVKVSFACPLLVEEFNRPCIQYQLKPPTHIGYALGTGSLHGSHKWTLSCLIFACFFIQLLKSWSPFCAFGFGPEIWHSLFFNWVYNTIFKIMIWQDQLKRSQMSPILISSYLFFLFETWS